MKFSNKRQHSKGLNKALRLRDKEIYSLSHKLFRYRLNDSEKEVIINQIKQIVGE